LIPYLSRFSEPFILISTGTWCISLNPYNHEPLTAEELNQDCLCYLTFDGRPVKASRLFAGYHHEQVCKNLSARYGKPADYYNSIKFEQQLLPLGSGRIRFNDRNTGNEVEDTFSDKDLSAFETYEEAYHYFMFELIEQQLRSTRLVLSETNVKQIFVDGGFGKNSIYMHLLALAFPELKVFAASMAQASAVGAAMAIHAHWNSNDFPDDIIDLKFYAAAETAGTNF
jgi:sugar (pentulose or hexulose) kinase